MNEPRADAPTPKPTIIVERLALVLTALATLVSMLAWTPAVALGVLVGGVLGTANFYALRWLVGGILDSTAKGATAPKRSGLVGLLMLKFGAMALALLLVVRFLPLDGTALIIGVSLVVFSIFVEGMRLVLRAAAVG